MRRRNGSRNRETEEEKEWEKGAGAALGEAGSPLVSKGGNGSGQ